MSDPDSTLPLSLPPSPPFPWSEYFVSLALRTIEGWVAYAIYDSTHASSFAKGGAIAICAWGLILILLAEILAVSRHLAEHLQATRVVAEGHFYGDKAQAVQRAALQIRWLHARFDFMSLSLLLHVAIIGFGVYLYYRS